MPIQFSFKNKNSFIPNDCTAKLRIKTQPNSTIKTNKNTKIGKTRGSFELILREAIPEKEKEKRMPLSPKKYDQLTLREIVES